MKILVTSIGAYAADIVIKTLRAGGHEVTGIDILPKAWLPVAYNTDRYIRAPRYTDRDEYKNFITRACAEHGLDCIMPLTDPELDIMGEMKEALAAAGVCACVSDLAVTRLCRDKHRLTGYLARENICPVIPSILLDEAAEAQLDFPLVAKPRFGRSSQGVIKVSSLAELEYVKETARETDYILLPYIEGSIISVDAVRSPDNKTVCVARRELQRNLNGAGTTVEIIENPLLNGICEKTADMLGIIGTAIFEFIETPEQLYLMEINPRFPGGVEFSHMAGYDVVTNHLRCFTGEAIETKVNIRKMIIARKYEAHITEISEE